MTIDARAQSLIGELGEGAYEHCRASTRFALSIESIEVAVVMAATAARVAQLQADQARDRAP